MPPRQRKPTAERRRQIAEAALEILCEQGVHRLTAMEIARRVGIADGTIFRHFKDKDEIVQAVIDHVSEVLLTGFPPEDPDPLDRLGRFFVDRLTLVRDNPAVLCVAMSDRLAEAAGEAGARRVAELQARVRSFVRGCLAEAREQGRVGRDLSPDVLTAVVVGTLRAAALGELGEGRAPPPERLWADLQLLLVRSAVGR